MRKKLAAGVLGLSALVTWAQTPSVYRCGNLYTNQPIAQQGCTPLNPANITVIEGTQVQSNPTSKREANPSLVDNSRIDAATQQSRDAQALEILRNEWQQAQSRHSQLLAEWNQGEPERRADEFKQPDKYQRRIADLKAALERSQADVAALQREMLRHANTQPSGAKP